MLERRGAARDFFGAAQKFQEGPMGIGDWGTRTGPHPGYRVVQSAKPHPNGKHQGKHP